MRRASAALAILTLVVSACVSVAPIESGTYRLHSNPPPEPVGGSAGGSRPPRLTPEVLWAGGVDLVELSVDTDALTATLTVDGVAREISLVERPRRRWASECPTGAGETALETFSIAENPLVVGPMSFVDPVLFAEDCDKPERVAIVSDPGPNAYPWCVIGNATCLIMVSDS